ncbi:MAG: hypothetical protein Q7R90_04190 [bacterium]|nr:hypothetical protein [bacterium]
MKPRDGWLVVCHHRTPSRAHAETLRQFFVQENTAHKRPDFRPKKLSISFDGFVGAMLKIGGIHARFEEWREILLPLLGFRKTEHGWVDRYWP